MTDNERKELLSKAKPILFNTEMVKAILDGRKTVTRRVIKPQPLLRLAYIFGGYGCRKWGYPDKNAYKYWGEEFKQNIELSEKERKRLWTPPCHTDDILYVRETWCKLTDWKDQYPDDEENMLITYYRADYSDDMSELATWHPSIHMPKEAARIFLRVTNVRVERLQDMTEEDAFMEGFSGIPWCAHSVYENYPDSPIPCEVAAYPDCPPDPPCNHSIPESFGMDIWDKTIKKSDLDKYGWDANPWVWVIEFERVG